MIPKEALDLIIAFEGYLKRLNDGTDRVKPYLCPARVPTIGYGSTRYFPGGKRVTMADPPISEARARECLAGELVECEQGVDRYTTKKLHPLMRGALVSFAYNCGAGAYQASTLRKRVNEGRWDQVPAQFAKWRSGGGRVLAGLVRRRNDEAKMFMRGVELMKSGAPLAEEIPADHPSPPVTPGASTPPSSTRPPSAIGVTIALRRFHDWFFSGAQQHVTH